MPVISIRAFLTVVIVIMGSISVVFAGSGMLSDLERSKNAQRVVDLVNISKTLFPAFITARIERGTQIPALLATNPADEAAWQRLSINRPITDANALAGIAVLSDGILPEAANLAAELQASHDELVAIRPAVDAAIRLPLTERDPLLLPRYRAIAGRYIDALVNATDHIEASLKLFDPRVDQLLLIKRSAWSARSYGGLLSIQIENAAALARPWTAEEIVTAAENRGHADLAWAMVNEAAALPNTPAELRAAVAVANAAATGPLAAQQKAVIDDLSHGRPASRSVADLQELNTNLLNSIVNVLKQAMTAMVAQSEAYKVAAVQHLIFSACILAAIVLLTSLGIYLVHRRVGGPIRRITDLMRRLADLDTSVEIDVTGRRDEIGEMTQALMVFRRAIEDRSRRDKEREMQRFLETMIDAMPVSITFKDADLRYLYVNRKRRQSIRDNSDPIGRRLSDIVDPRLAATVEAIDRRILATGLAEHFEQVWTDAEGSPVVVWSLKTPFRDQTGTIRGVITCGVDITRVKAAEAELIEQREAAEIANHSKSAFLASMSHELRTPLNAIIGFAEVLAAGYMGALGDRQQDYVINIKKAGEHLLAMVNDLLDLSRLETGRPDLQMSECSFDRIAVAALSMVRPQADKAGVKLVFTPTNLTLRADERALAQILVNLLSNAVKFSRPESQVVLRAVPSPGGIRIEIEDSGIGMTNEQREAALTATIQSDPYRARPRGGAGLGFPICRRLVELHHGSLDINSQPGDGSIVSIFLPAT
jgi:PAS domain S-box-containing protein